MRCNNKDTVAIKIIVITVVNSPYKIKIIVITVVDIQYNNTKISI